MGGDDSQKLLPWRGIHSSPGRKPPAQLRINNVTETAGWNLAPGHHRSGPGLSYRPPGSLLESRGGSILPRAEAPEGAARQFAIVHSTTGLVMSELLHCPGGCCARRS
jgi:hypothetical protein